MVILGQCKHNKEKHTVIIISIAQVVISLVMLITSEEYGNMMSASITWRQALVISSAIHQSQEVSADSQIINYIHNVQTPVPEIISHSTNLVDITEENLWKHHINFMIDFSFFLVNFLNLFLKHWRCLHRRNIIVLNLLWLLWYQNCSLNLELINPGISSLVFTVFRVRGQWALGLRLGGPSIFLAETSWVTIASFTPLRHMRINLLPEHRTLLQTSTRRPSHQLEEINQTNWNTLFYGIMSIYNITFNIYNIKTVYIVLECTLQPKSFATCVLHVDSRIPTCFYCAGVCCFEIRTLNINMCQSI